MSNIALDIDDHVADYALADFMGRKIWIYRQDGIFELLIPIDDLISRTAFSHKMLKFDFSTYQINGGEFEKYLSVRPPTSELSDVFLSFIRFTLDEVASQNSIEDAIAKIIEKYEEWSEFFASSALGKDSTSKIIGLIGELLVLENVIKQFGAGGISSWWGPVRHRHDFEFANSGIEVKTTVNPHSNEVEIHGLKQLTPDPERSLYLAHLKINLDPNGLNLSELIKRILKMEVSKFELDEKIGKSGVTIELIESFSDFKFNGFIARYFLVDSAFPSISQDNLAIDHLARISRVSYKITLNDLAHSNDFPSVEL
jgi:hypothetical protein